MAKLPISILWQWNGNICLQLLFIKRHCWLFRQVCLFRRAVPGFKYHLRHLWWNEDPWAPCFFSWNQIFWPHKLGHSFLCNVSNAAIYCHSWKHPNSHLVWCCFTFVAGKIHWDIKPGGLYIKFVFQERASPCCRMQRVLWPWDAQSWNSSAASNQLQPEPLLPCVHVSSPCSMPPEAPAGRQPVAGLACQPELCLSSRVTSVGWRLIREAREGKAAEHSKASYDL